MRRRSNRLVLALVSALVGMLSGCPRDEFRTVATPALHNGVSLILNGVLDGFFAAIAPESGQTN